jgi:hypothetical protein
MLWLDTDSFCTRKWNRDPVAMAMRSNLAIFFANFPGGNSKGEDFDRKYLQAFNKKLCDIQMVDGHLEVKSGNCPNRRDPRIPHIHGFFHITNLDFYRSERVQNWLKILIGDIKFSRRYDDQIAVTIPAAILEPNRSWEMEFNGFRPEIYHNHFLDGKIHLKSKGFRDTFWPANGKTIFPEAYGICAILANT